ncbi:hypothetical protein ACKVMT_01565 [Halobacteriales archaeon Cl-PHB]
MMGERGQAYTLEGVIAAIVVAASVLYGLQAVNVAPWATSADERQLESMRTQAEDLLAATADDGTLRRMVTCVKDPTGQPNGIIAVPPGEVAGTPGVNATTFGNALNRTFRANGYRYAVYFDYWNETTSRVESELVYPRRAPTPTRSTVSASYPVTLFDGTNVSTSNDCIPDDEALETRVDDGDPLYVDELDGSGDPETFAVVEVRLVVW